MRNRLERVFPPQPDPIPLPATVRSPKGATRTYSKSGEVYLHEGGAGRVVDYGRTYSSMQLAIQTWIKAGWKLV